MEIIKLAPAKYAGLKFTIRYTTGGYYDILPDASGFRIEYRQFENTLEKSFDDVFFSKWLEAPTGYGAFENGRMIGFDLYSYSNHDPERHEVRIEMGRAAI